VSKGIPPEEIAYIHEANTEVRKKELFSKVRSGQVRVLIGSTAKMGAGTNCQDKLIALHDADCPWRPSDLAQRLGRIVRQGNQNPEVEIFRYVTENTFDAYLYQLVENKQKFIAQIMTSKAPARIADDVDETALSYSEIKALATGNPLIIEKCNLDVEVSKLNMLKANHLNQRFALENMVLRKYPADIAKLTEAIAGYEKDVATAQAHPKPAEGFVGMEVMGTHYSEKEAAGKAVIRACTELQSADPIPLGQYRGFSMSLQYDAAHTDYKLTMKGAMSHTISLGADVFGNITVLSFVMIMTVYGRFFKLYLYTAIAPVPLSAFAGEPTQSIGISFIKSYAAVCLEGAIIVLGCIIFSLFAATPPVVDPNAAAVSMVWSYVGELVFNMLILVGTVKMADRVVREMMGL